MAQVDNKRVAKNALALTIRTVITTLVGLYTSRIVLEALGVDDYGIYGVIGGVIGMASFLNGAMAGASSRFITYALGRGETDRLQTIFSTALIIHVFIALIVLILAETLGLWFVNAKMNFPEGRMTAVNILYQFTIISMLVSFTQVPYTAMIMAYEKMNIYAYIEIVNVMLKLIVVYLLLLIDNDRLVFYAAMMLAISIVSALLYRYYCLRKFKKARLSFVWDKEIIKSMLAFSGLDLYGNMCTTMKFQGIPILLNMFFGVVANAGASIANTVTGAISGMTISISQAFNPQIIKQYSAGNIEQMLSVMRRAVQFTLLAYAAIGLPIFVKAHTVLFLWLGQVPEYSVEFIRLIIITAFFSIIVTSSNAALHATGNIKKISFYSGTIHLMVPLISYFLLRYYFHNANIIYIVNIVLMVFLVVLGFRFISLQIPELNIGVYIRAVVMSMISIVISYAIVIWIEKGVSILVYDNSFLTELLIVVFLGLSGGAILFAVAVVIALNKSERDYLMAFLKGKLRFIKGN